jgi:CBS domain-containing protein
VFVFGWLVVTNVILAVFNMLPAFPMDGGRVLRALLARRRSYLSATRTAARIGTGFAIGFAILAVLSLSPLLFLLALFVYGAASGESRTVALDTLLEGITVEDIVDRDVEGVDADATLSAFAERMLRDRRTTYPVVDGGSIVGIVSLADLKGVSEADRDATRVREVSAADPPRIAATATAFDGLMELAKHRTEAALVEDGGKTVGVVSNADISQLLDLREQGLGSTAGTPAR